MSRCQRFATIVAVLSVLGFSSCTQQPKDNNPPVKVNAVPQIQLGADASGSGRCTQNGVEGGNTVVPHTSPNTYPVTWKVPGATSVTVVLSGGCGSPPCKFGPSTSDSLSVTLSASSTSTLTYSSVSTNSGSLCTPTNDGLIMR